MSEAMENKTMETPVEEVVVERVKPYQLRELCAEDIFPMFTILRKIGIKEFKECFSKEAIESIVEVFMNGAKAKVEANAECGNEHESEDSQDNTLVVAGLTMLPSVLDIADVLLCNIPKCEHDFYKFLAGISNLKTEEIKKLPMADFVGMIVDVIKKEEFKDFFKVVSELFK